MPLRLDITKKFSARSERVKSVDFHPTEPWILSALYNGTIMIWNYKSQQMEKSFEVCELPVRCAKFVPRKSWIVCAADDMTVRVFNYNTMAKIKAFDAHVDYIRCVAVHPTQPYILTCGDDMLIKAWDWEKGWANVMTFEGHVHYVMMVTFNPKDPNTFASASLDRTIKVWGLGSPYPNFTLEGHEKGVNCCAYFGGGDKPYIVSGSDDRTLKVWDYQNKACVHTLEGHTHNISCVAFHPTRPVIVSAAEDGTVRIWNSNTYKLEKTLNYGMERAWTLDCLEKSNKVAIGFDDGTLMFKLGKEEPPISMAPNGKIVWAKQNLIQTVNVRTVKDDDLIDGEKLALPVKDLGNCDVYPQLLRHDSKGRFVVAVGDGEWIVYTALGLRNYAFGAGYEFVWGLGKGQYAVKEASSRIKTFENGKEAQIIRPNYTAEGIYGGPLIAVRANKFVCFYTWTGILIRRIDVVPKNVQWSDNGEVVVLTCESSFYLLKYNKELLEDALRSGAEFSEAGIEDSFELFHEVGEKVRTGIWVGDCFVYTSANNRLCYSVGGEIFTIAHLDTQLYLLGYLPANNRLYLATKSLEIVTYLLHIAIINFQTAVIRGDMESAKELLPKIPDTQLNNISTFLESQGFKEEALRVSRDPDHKFDLAVQLERLDLAYDIACEHSSGDKWQQLADLTLARSDFRLAEECMKRSGDLQALLMLHSCLANHEGLRELVELAEAQRAHNIAFAALFSIGDVDRCLQLLCDSGRIPEAAFFARTYAPSRVSDMVKLWRADLAKVNKRAAESLADPTEYGNLFPYMKAALQAERKVSRERVEVVDPSSYPEMRNRIFRDLIEEVTAMGLEEDEDEAGMPAVDEKAGDVHVGEPDLLGGAPADIAGEVPSGETDLLGGPARGGSDLLGDLQGGSADNSGGLFGHPAAHEPALLGGSADDLLGSEDLLGASDNLLVGADDLLDLDDGEESLI